MNAPQNASGPAPAPLRSDRRVFTTRLAVGVLCLALASICSMACQPAGGPEASASGATVDEPFQFIRSKVGIARIDTRTGQVSTVPLNGDGGWAPRGEAPPLGDEPARVGRFDIMNIAQQRNVTRIGTPPPVMIRVDRATGASWLLESEEATSWTAIRESGAPPVTPSETGSAAAATGAAPGGSRVLAESSDAVYPILTGDQLGVTPEEKEESVQTLRMALAKEGLPQNMRVWAVRQLGEVDPDLAVPELLLALEDEDPVIVVEAITQLGEIGRPSTIPPILKLQSHPDPSVREAAAKVVVEVE